MKYNEEQEENSLRVRKGLEEDLEKMKTRLKDREDELQNEKNIFLKQLEELKKNMTEDKEEKDNNELQIKKQDELNELRSQMTATVLKMESEHRNILSKLEQEQLVSSDLRMTMEKNLQVWEKEKFKLTCDQTQTHQNLTELQEKLKLLSETNLQSIKLEEMLSKDLDEARLETTRLKDELAEQTLLHTNLIAEKENSEAVRPVETLDVCTSNNNGLTIKWAITVILTFQILFIQLVGK